jgi:hypothetical protein
MGHYASTLQRASLVAAVLLLSLLGVGCRSDKAVGGGKVDWSSFTPVPPPPGVRALNIGDVAGETGLALVLPSYLPEGVGKRFVISVSEYNIGEVQYIGVTVTLFPTSRDDLGIYIDESKLKTGEPTPEPGVPRRAYPPDSQLAKIGHTDVACWVEVAQHSGLPTPPPPQPTEDPERHMIFRCGWYTAELLFDVDFVWGSPEPVPGEIAPERREEAMKVVTSMIEDPYIP